MSIKTFKTKKFIKFAIFFLFTVQRVRSAVVRENLTPIREYLSTVKNRQKCSTLYRRVVVKGLRQCRTLQLGQVLPDPSTTFTAAKVCEGDMPVATVRSKNYYKYRPPLPPCQYDRGSLPPRHRAEERRDCPTWVSGYN